MDPITQQTVLAAAGAAGGDPVYVDDVFSTFLYDGTGSAQTINNGIDLSGEGGLVWIKNRSGSSSIYGNFLYDTERGVTKYLASESSAGEGTNNAFSSFNNNGFSIGTINEVNRNNYAYASWSFRKAPGFFDVVTYTGNGTAGRTVAHNLGSVPGMIIIKILNSDKEWFVYHRSLGATKNLRLNATDAERTQTIIFNDTEPTSTHFTLGSEADVNGTGNNFVAYIFAHDDAQYGTDGDESIIKCGSFSGIGFKDIGFEPQFLLVKQTNGTGNWQIYDHMRGVTWTSAGIALYPNTTDAEGGTMGLRFEPTGFYNDTYGSSTAIYMAIRRPHKPPEAATDVFAIDTGNSSSTTPCWDSGFPVDFAIMTYPTTTYPKQVATRLMGSKHLTANGTNGESNDSDFTWDSNVGWGKTWNHNTYSWMFKRAPGFMDNVVYKGDAASNRAVDHNLGVTPELLIVKRFDNIDPWRVQYTGIFGAGTALRLDDAGAVAAGSAFNGASAPTASNFYVGSDSEANGSGERYVAYLFATLPGISKVGSYTGTGNDIDVDCGFTNGARFVLIKRTDVGGDWDLMDSVRGITIGNDKHLALNTDTAQGTSSDFIDPLNTGFTVSAAAPNDINQSGGTYLFLAIA